MPYFRKSSALNEIGWGSLGTSSSSSKESSLPKSESSKTIPLKLCYLCRNLIMPDMQNRTIELHSPDAKSSVFLRCPDDRAASQWFSALHSCIEALNQSAIDDTNRILMTNAANSVEVRHMGWLAEQVNFRNLII